jgi:hypothetical protein
MAEDIPTDVKQFIAEHLNSVAELEVLLLVKGESAREWTPEDISKLLCMPAEVIEGHLVGLESRGLLAATPAPPRYRFHPRTTELEQVVHCLDEIYKERRVSVITLIYSKPVDKVRTFADAFRLRKGE